MSNKNHKHRTCIFRTVSCTVHWMRQRDQKPPNTWDFISMGCKHGTEHWTGNLNFKYSQVLDFEVFLFDSLGILKIVLIVSVEKSQPSGLRPDLPEWEQSLSPGSGTNHGCHIWQITSWLYFDVLQWGKLLERGGWKEFSGWCLFNCYG